MGISGHIARQPETEAARYRDNFCYRRAEQWWTPAPLQRRREASDGRRTIDAFRSGATRLRLASMAVRLDLAWRTRAPKSIGLNSRPAMPLMSYAASPWRNAIASG